MLFIDSGDLSEIQQACDMGFVWGATTNAKLLSIADYEVLKARILEIIEVVTGPVSCQVLSTNVDEMVYEALEFASWHERVVVKIPATLSGFKAMRQLKGKIPINATAIVEPLQAVMCASLGVRYVSLFYSRMSDAGIDPEEAIVAVSNVLARSSIKRPKIIVGSIRCKNQVTKALVSGADIVTVPWKILLGAINNPGTNKFIEELKNILMKARCLARGANDGLAKKSSKDNSTVS